MTKPARLKPSRLANRASTDLKEIKKILEQSTICTVSYQSDKQAYALPTAFVLHNNEVVIHGSAKSDFLRGLIDQRVCISVFQLNGYVLAASAFHHSMNYSSVVLFSKPREITRLSEKEASLRAFTEKIVPERWTSLRPVTEGELGATRVLAFSLKEASCKTRTGGPSDEKEDENFPTWTGVIPLELKFNEPQPASNKEKVALPDHIKNLYK